MELEGALSTFLGGRPVRVLNHATAGLEDRAARVRRRAGD